MTALIEMTQVTKTYGEGRKVVALHETNFQPKCWREVRG